MSSIIQELGTLSWPSTAIIEFFYQGEWIPFPLVLGSEIFRTPLTAFAPSVKIGDSSRGTDPRLSVRIWNDFSGGLGKLQAHGDKDLLTYYDGNLDTRQPGVVVLPPKHNDLFNTAVNLVPPTHVQVTQTSSGQKNVIVWGERHAGVYAFNAGTLAVTTPFVVGPHAYQEFNGLHYLNFHASVGAGPFSIWNSPDGITWTGRINNANFRGLVEHDFKLWTWNVSDGLMYQSIDGITYTSVTTAGPPRLKPFEQFRQLFTWRSPSGQSRNIFMLTTHRILIMENESNEWHEFNNGIGFIQADYNWAHVNKRNDDLYVTFWNSVADRNGMVLHFTGGTVDELGPKSKGGFPDTIMDNIGHLESSTRNIIAFGTGRVSDGTPGRIMAMNDFRGWHSEFDPLTSAYPTTYVSGGGYFDQTLYAALYNGRILNLPLPDRLEIHPVADGANRYAINEHYLTSSRDDFNLPNVIKIGAFFTVDVQLANGISGLPLGATLKLRYRIDQNQLWVTLPIMGNMTSHAVGLLGVQSLDPGNVVFPLTLPLPDGLVQAGVPFEHIQWEVRMSKTPTGTSPALVEVSLYYILYTEKHYSYQFVIDLSDETFNQIDNFAGRDRQQLQQVLFNLSNTKGFVQARFGALENATNILAMDMLTTARITANTGGAFYTVSARDLYYAPVIAL